MGGRGGGQGRDGGGARVDCVAQRRQAEAGLGRAEQGVMVVGGLRPRPATRMRCWRMPTLRRRSSSPARRTRMSPRPGRPRASASSGTTGTGSPATTAADRAAGGWRGAMQAVGVRDPGGASLRRAARVAIVVPTLAAFAGTIIGNPAASTFAVFGAFALLGLADFGGPTIPRARAYAGATVVGAGLVLLGTLASGSDWSAVAGTVLVAFVVQLLGVFGGYVSAAQTALLLAFVVAVSLPAPAAAGWARVAGWTLAGGVALAAGVLLWPRHARTQVRQRAGEACQALAELLADPAAPPTVQEQARARVEATRRAYAAAPLRPAGPASRDRALVDLVIELGRALEFAGRTTPASNPTRTIPEERALRQTITEVLEASAGVLTGGAGPPEMTALDQARTAYRDALDRWAGDRLRAGDPAESVLEGLDAGGRLRLLATPRWPSPSTPPRWPVTLSTTCHRRCRTGGRLAPARGRGLVAWPPRSGRTFFRPASGSATACGPRWRLGWRSCSAGSPAWSTASGWCWGPCRCCAPTRWARAGRPCSLSAARWSGSWSRPCSPSPSAPARWRCGSRCRSWRSWPPTCRPPSRSWSARQRSRCSWSSCSTCSSRRAGGWDWSGWRTLPSGSG